MSRLSREDGYVAAHIAIRRLLDEASKDRPKSPGKVNKRSAAYREGLFMGLNSASCLSAWGEFPNHPDNTKEIFKVLNHE